MVKCHGILEMQSAFWNLINVNLKNSYKRTWGIKEHLVVLNVNSVNYANKHSSIHINVFMCAFCIKNFCKLGNHWNAISKWSLVIYLSMWNFFL